jgi:hypothetical protein
LREVDDFAPLQPGPWCRPASCVVLGLLKDVVPDYSGERCHPLFAVILTTGGISLSNREARGVVHLSLLF